MRKSNVYVPTPEEKEAERIRREQQNHRRELEKMRHGMNVKDALLTVRQIMMRRDVKGVRVGLTELDMLHSDCHLGVERGWAVGCDLYVKFPLWGAYDDRVEDPENNKVWMKVNYEIELSWSSSGRTPLQALACVNLYKEMVDLAAEIEAYLVSNDIVFSTKLDKGKEVAS